MLHARSVTPQRVVDRKKGELSQNSGMRRSCQKLHDKENQISYINAALNANKKVPMVNPLSLSFIDLTRSGDSSFQCESSSPEEKAIKTEEAEIEICSQRVKSNS